MKGATYPDYSAADRWCRATEQRVTQPKAGACPADGTDLDARCAECGRETDGEDCEFCSLATGLDPVELEPRTSGGMP